MNKVFDDFFTDFEQDNSSKEISSNDTIKNEEQNHSIVILDSEEEPENISKSESIKKSTVHKSCVDASNKKSNKCKMNHIKFGVKSSSKPFNPTKRQKSKKSSGKVLKCTVCRKVFRGERVLIFHRRIHLDEFPIHCRVCLDTFLNEKQRERHENNCEKLRYECYVCRKIINLRANLVTHMRTHSGRRPFGCEYCTRRFKVKSNWKKHQKSAHGKSRHVVKKRKKNQLNVVESKRIKQE